MKSLHRSVLACLVAIASALACGEEGAPPDLLPTLGSIERRDPRFDALVPRDSVIEVLASGFVWEGDKAPGERRAESALHAWVEAFLPGAGWIGLDPTNGVFCDHHFVTTAVGLNHEDISPVAGTYYGKKAIASMLAAKLEVQKA